MEEIGEKLDAIKSAILLSQNVSITDWIIVACTIISLVVAFWALFSSISATKKQNKIALFDKRYKAYVTFMSFYRHKDKIRPNNVEDFAGCVLFFKRSQKMIEMSSNADEIVTDEATENLKFTMKIMLEENIYIEQCKEEVFLAKFCFSHDEYHAIIEWFEIASEIMQNYITDYAEPRLNPLSNRGFTIKSELMSRLDKINYDKLEKAIRSIEECLLLTKS